MRRTIYEGDTEKVKDSTCRGGESPHKGCSKGFGGPLCARCDGSNSFQMDRNKENIDYTNGCMKCNGQIASARVTVFGYFVAAIILAAALGYSQDVLVRCAHTYLPFVFVALREFKSFRDKGKIMLTYTQVSQSYVPLERIQDCLTLYRTQIVSQYMDGTITVRWPAMFNMIAVRLQFVNLNFLAYFSSTCAFKVRHRESILDIHA